MKMSDIFEIENGSVAVGNAGRDIYQGISRNTIDIVGEFECGQHAFYAAHAIRSYDKLVESLREVIDLSKSPHEHKEARERASKLLADLENSDA